MAASPVIAPGSFKPEINRRSANYHSSVWGDYFLSCASDFKFEKQREHIASSVECYAKQHGVTEAEAVRELRRRVTDGWKDVNEACLHLTAVPMSLLARILNLTRVIDVLYKNKDGYTHSSTSTKAMVSSLLVDPVLV